MTSKITGGLLLGAVSWLGCFTATIGTAEDAGTTTATSSSSSSGTTHGTSSSGTTSGATTSSSSSSSTGGATPCGQGLAWVGDVCAAVTCSGEPLGWPCGLA